MIGEVTMSEKSDKLRAMLAKEKERRIKLNNRIEILERRIQEEDSAEVNEMVRTAKVTPEQLAALLRQSATTTPNPAALSAVGATFEKEDEEPSIVLPSLWIPIATYPAPEIYSTRGPPLKPPVKSQSPLRYFEV